jgi:hypothetical protein
MVSRLRPVIRGGDFAGENGLDILSIDADGWTGPGLINRASVIGMTRGCKKHQPKRYTNRQE